MSIRWDPILVREVARELSRRVGGSRVRGFLLDPGPRNLLVYGREWTLALELHPTAGYLQLLPPRDPPQSAHTFASRLRSIEATPDDRILTLGLQKIRGRGSSLDLVVELVGNRWNALAVERETGTIRHVLVPRQRGPEPRLSGVAYAPPRARHRGGVREPLSLDEWTELLLPLPAEERRSSLLRNVAYTSSINVPALLGRAAEEDAGRVVEEHLRQGWELWCELRVLDSPRPALLPDPRGPQPYPYPIPLPAEVEGRIVITESLLDAFGRARVEAAPDRPSVFVPSTLVRELEGAIERVERRMRGLQRELEEAPDPVPLRRTGDLLLARFEEIRRGAEEVAVVDFEGEEVRIPLDPALAPHENAERYYDRAARAERAKARLPGMIRKEERRLQEYREMRGALKEERVTPEEVRRKADLTGRPDRGRAGSGGDVQTLPYRRYRSSGGLEIRVGRGARRNDDLTFRHSDPNDVWLHARHAAGAHVILRWTGEGSPPSRDLAEAAVLAAVHSEARTSGSVPVDWTRRKYVRKPRKAPPGSVIPDRVQTLFAEPSAAMEKRLRVG